MTFQMTLYRCPIDRVAAVMGDLAQLDGSNASALPSLERLRDGDFVTDPETSESPDAASLIAALETVCAQVASAEERCEFDYDSEDTPDLTRFAFDDWDADNDFDLPLSPDGTPAVVYRDAKSLVDFLAYFRGDAKNNLPEEFLSPDDADLIARFISDTLENRTGLFVFSEQ